MRCVLWTQRRPLLGLACHSKVLCHHVGKIDGYLAEGLTQVLHSTFKTREPTHEALRAYGSDRHDYHCVSSLLNGASVRDPKLYPGFAGLPEELST